jgi:hypothetical protein
MPGRCEVRARHGVIPDLTDIKNFSHEICGFAGGQLGGVMSDFLLRKGYSLTVARKTPIVVGMVLSMAMIACNYTDVQRVIVALMALAFFGKGVGALGWAVMSYCAPKEITGLAGGVFNMCGNLSSISTDRDWLRHPYVGLVQRRPGVRRRERPDRGRRLPRHRRRDQAHGAGDASHAATMKRGGVVNGRGLVRFTS